jgi:hypothetical protein
MASFNTKNFISELPLIIVLSAIPATATYFISKENKVKNSLIAGGITAVLVLVASYKISKGLEGSL